MGTMFYIIWWTFYGQFHVLNSIIGNLCFNQKPYIDIEGRVVFMNPDLPNFTYGGLLFSGLIWDLLIFGILRLFLIHVVFRKNKLVESGGFDVIDHS